MKEVALVPEKKKSGGWLVIFSDLISLMLTFFVLLFSMSSIKVKIWEEMAEGLSLSLNPLREIVVVTPSSQFNISTILRKDAIELHYLHGTLETKLKQIEVFANARLIHLGDRVVVSLPGDLLFGSGSAQLNDAAREAVFNLGSVLSTFNNQIVVNGHTDPNPVSGDRYVSNWELSLARAVAVANTLKQAGYPEDPLILGYASTRIGALANLPDAERFAFARRVDISILKNVGLDR